MEIEAGHIGSSAHHLGHRGIAPFLRHFVEMVVAMLVGMALGGFLGVYDVASTELLALSMALSMSVPMIGWMRYRRHSWRASGEMAAAMMAPAIALCPPFWWGFISDDTLIGLQHVLMLPAMLAVMLYRRSDFGL